MQFPLRVAACDRAKRPSVLLKWGISTVWRAQPRSSCLLKKDKLSANCWDFLPLVVAMDFQGLSWGFGSRIVVHLICSPLVWNEARGRTLTLIWLKVIIHTEQWCLPEFCSVGFITHSWRNSSLNVQWALLKSQIPFCTSCHNAQGHCLY